MFLVALKTVQSLDLTYAITWCLCSQGGSGGGITKKGEADGACFLLAIPHKVSYQHATYCGHDMPGQVALPMYGTAVR